LTIGHKFDQLKFDEHPIEAKNLPFSIVLNDSPHYIEFMDLCFPSEMCVFSSFHFNILFLQNDYD
jgi:hypothetical protein